jgi:predicted nucleotidyltransferase
MTPEFPRPEEEPIAARVSDALSNIEEQEHVRILYACESGSRAWGFPSRDSDFDVRFIYVHSRDWYLSVNDRRDVIERPLTNDLDVSGWDLWKALRLLQKSNPPLLEWLKSPIIYRQNEQFAEEFRALIPKCYSPRRSFGHYLHMASGNWHRYLEGREQVSLKKYLYIFRPLLACRWIQRGLGQVPMLFQELVDAVLDETDVRAELDQLVARKRAGDELDREPPIALLSEFIAAEIRRLEQASEPEEAACDLEDLNPFFRKYVLEAGP